MEILSFPFTRSASGGLARARARVAPGLALVLRPGAAAGTRAEPAWAALWSALAGLAFALELPGAHVAGAGALAILAVLGAGWTLGPRPFAAVLALGVAVQAAGGLLGGVHPLLAGAGLAALLAAGGAGRTAALGQAEAVRARRREATTLLRTSRLGRSLDQERVAAEAVRVAASTVPRFARPDERRAVLVRAAGDRVTLLAGHGRSGAEVRPGLELPLRDMPPALRETLRTGRPDVVPVAGLQPALRDLAALPDAGAWAIARVQVAGEAFGILSVAGPDAAAFGPEDLRLLDGVARVAGLAMATAVQRAEVLELERRLRGSADVTADVGRSPGPSEVAVSVLARMAESVGAGRAALARLDGAGLVVEPVRGPGAAAGPAPAERRFGAESVEAVPGLARALAAGQPFVGGPLEVLPGGEALAEALAGGGHALAFPLGRGGRAAGVLVLGREGGPAFDSGDVARLEPPAGVALLALRDARLLAEARQAGRAKGELLDLAAHELRTPLAVIRGYLSLLEDGTYPVPERTREEAVGTLVMKARELELLVEALLTAARLEVGRLPRAPGPFDVCEAVRQAAARAGPRARLEEARIGVRAPGRAVTAFADRGQVARVLDNLLNNALTYSARPASVTVEVRAGDPVEVAVRDLGRGIAHDQHERVFERFHRLGDADPGLSPGLGLGLSISRELAQLNGGALVLEGSAPGRGSVFVLRLPAAPGA